MGGDYAPEEIVKGAVNGGGPAVVLRSTGGGIHIKTP